MLDITIFNAQAEELLKTPAPVIHAWSMEVYSLKICSYAY